MAQALPLLPDALSIHWKAPEELAVQKAILLFVKDPSLGGDGVLEKMSPGDGI